MALINKINKNKKFRLSRKISRKLLSTSDQLLMTVLRCTVLISSTAVHSWLQTESPKQETMHRYAKEIHPAALLLLVHSIPLILSFTVCCPLFSQILHTQHPQISVSHTVLESIQFRLQTDITYAHMHVPSAS